MLKSFSAIAAAATIAIIATGAPTAAKADCVGCGVAAGVLGGLAAGAIIGSAVAGPPAYIWP